MKSVLTCICVSLLVVNTLQRDINGRIVGGKPAGSGEYPFIAAIYVNGFDGSHFCGGTLISQQHILTAGQCVAGAIAFQIHLGSNALSGADSNRLTVEANNWVLHPDFNPATLENDIGIIILHAPIQYTNFIRNVHYLPVKHIGADADVTSLGWGETTDTSTQLSEALLEVNITTMSNDDCQKVFGSQIVETMLCAKGAASEGTCNGDTGSPLLLKMTYQSMHVGIASFHSGNGCESNDPSGYTRVFHYLDWIESIVGTL